jgi:16S rRNA C1402 N4-methylase RsmH
MFGGDAEDIAHEIIQLRKNEPIASTDKLESELYSYGESIRKCKPYITTTSTFFTIKVTAESGKARASLVALINKEKNKMKKIAIVSNL